MSYVIYSTKPSKYGPGSVYVIELNPAEVMRWRVARNDMPFHGKIFNRKGKLVLRYWHIGKWGKKRHLREMEEKARIFINALKAGVKHTPDFEREERLL
jgi:hypothetical protein